MREEYHTKGGPSQKKKGPPAVQNSGTASVFVVLVEKDLEIGAQLDT